MSLEMENARRRMYVEKFYKWSYERFLRNSFVDYPNLMWFRRSIKASFDRRDQSKFLLIGLCGNAGVGKDSATEVFNQFDKNSGFRCMKMAFADPIREIGKIFGFTAEQMSDRRLKEMNDDFWKFSPRYFMQKVGTEMFRKNLREDVWIELMHKRLIDLTKLPASEAPKIVFITDVRFENEANFIRNQGGFIIKIHRSGFSKEGANLHDSERFISMIKADKVFENKAEDGDIWSWEFAKDLTEYFAPESHKSPFGGFGDKGIQSENYIYA